MDTHLKFTDIKTEGRQKSHRRDDFEAFEFTYKSEITNIHQLTEMENLYRIQILDPEERKRFTFQPGQFLMLELPGIGEAPFSISSPPSRHGDVELCIRKAGNLTNFLAKISRGTHVGIRGPFGTNFPMEKMHSQNIFLIAGGLGLAPLRAKDPSQLLFTYQYDTWQADDINLNIIVEKTDPSWKGPVGLITKILEEIFSKKDDDFFKNTYAIVCGPPVMFKFVCNMLGQKDIPMQKMFVSLERRMHCGMGKCCRCNVGSTYTCLKGPVFDYWSVMNLKEAI